jgi:hypothetical protein
MHTVSELYPLVRAQAGSAGVCDVGELMERMNIVGPEILDRIEAKGTITTWCLPVCNSCVVLPSDLDTPIQAWLDGTPLGFRGQYWLGRLGGDIPTDMGQSYPWQELVDDSRYVYTQVYPIPHTINDVFEVTARSQKDAGKVVSITYRDQMGRQIVYDATLAGDHTASNPSDTGIGDVIHVSKPRTVGGLELWMRNLRFDNRFLVAVYDGVDEHPQYRLVHITGCVNGKLVIKGRKKWLPLRSEDDVVPFGRVAVWRTALIAESKLANRELEEYGAGIEAAVAQLEAELSGLRPKGTAEVVDFVTPWTIRNRR